MKRLEEALYDFFIKRLLNWNVLLFGASAFKPLIMKNFKNAILLINFSEKEQTKIDKFAI